ncbi:MAG: helix-turn-helix transcriptional regulator [Actinomycetota bacterium]
MSDEEPAIGRPDRLAAMGALGEPTRRALYDHVAAAGGWVSRDEAADALDLERGTVAHHLDRLASDGLLEVEYRRLSGKQGPGAGRPAKLYRRAQRDFDVTLPPRDYQLAGRMLAEAVDRARTARVDIAEAVDEVATAEGRRLAAEIESQLRGARPKPSANRRGVVVDALERHGFEPRTADDGTIVLRNCPFHQLAQQHTDLICGMNLSMMKAAIAAVGDTGLEARLEPDAGQCCVKLGPPR